MHPDSARDPDRLGQDIIYDVLLVALGARPYPAFDNGVTFERELSPEDFDEVLADLTDGMAPRVAIIVPDGVSGRCPPTSWRC